MKSKVIEVIYKSIDDIKDTVSNMKDVNKSKDMVLFGNKGLLDSLGLVTLVVSVEQNLQEQLDISVTLADEKAMSQQVSPFKTIDTLAEYIIKLVEDKNYA
ncbi:MAG: acyl carrier protein [bacterium]|nr:acyl carrier protein [bacterium]